MFRWLKANNEASRNIVSQKDQQKDSSTFLRVSELLEKSTTVRQLINEIQAMVGVTQADFQSLYRETLKNLLEHLQTPGQSFDEENIAQRLAIVVIALRKRQGLLLPKGADSEVIFREREEWSYAVFAVSLLVGLPIEHRQALAKAIIPKQAFDWLHRTESLFEKLQGFLAGNSKDNVFAELTPQAMLQKNSKADLDNVIQEPTNSESHTDSLPSNRQIVKDKSGDADKEGAVNTQQSKSKAPSIKDSQSDSSQKLSQDKEQQSTGSEKTNKPRQTAEKKIQSATVLPQLKKTKNPIVAVDLKEQKVLKNALLNDGEVTQLETFSSKKPAPYESLSPADFMQWLTRAIEAKVVSINKIDSAIHRVNEGLLLVLPVIVDQYAKHKVDQQTVSKENSFTKRTTLLKQLKKHEQFEQQANGSRIHTYYLGEWAKRHLVSGLIVKPENMLTHAAASLPINKQLQLDPIN